MTTTDGTVRLLVGAEKQSRDIRTATRRKLSAEQTIRIVLEGLRR